MVTVRLPMRVLPRPANDDPGVAAVTYGPVVLAGDYGNAPLSALPTRNVGSVTRTSTSSLAFTATANGATVNLGAFHDAHGYNYTVYWNTGGGGGTETGYRLYNVASGLVLGVQDMSTSDGGLAVQWHDTGTADHRWTVVDNGDGTHKLRNANSSQLLGILNGSTTAGTHAVQDPDNGSNDNRWRLVPVGARRSENLAGGLVGVRDPADGTRTGCGPRSPTPTATSDCATAPAARGSASRTA